METEFIEGKFPSGHRYDFDPYLFNLPANLSLQAKDGWHSFYAVRADKKLVRAHVHFRCEGTVASSPFRNPFGSFEFSDAFTPKELFDFIKFVKEALHKKGISKMIVKSCPQCYDSYRTSLLSTFLLNQGFKVDEAELSACIEIRQTDLFDSLSSFEKRKLKEQKKSAFAFRQLALEKWKEVFHFIESCREERNQSLSMTAGELQEVVRAFPDNFLLFAVYDAKVLTAASIAIRINKSILYNFYPAHAKEYNKVSPMVGLIEGMYKFCQKESIKLMDLGTSSLRGKPNFSLLNFKINMGAEPTPKFSFIKEW